MPTGIAAASVSVAATRVTRGHCRALVLPQDFSPCPEQPADRRYAEIDLDLEIPRLGVQMDIVGVPIVDDAWDTTWLNRDAGWMKGSANPTWEGNTVITGLVWDAFNQPGPFAVLKMLRDR